MNSLLLHLALALSVPGAGQSKPTALVDGTLIFLNNASSVVELATRGDIGHVALVFHDAGSAWVYEATPAKVRRVTAEAYWLELARLNKRRDEDELIQAFALRPKIAYTREEAAVMRAFLDSQLDRRYSVKNYVRGRPYDGIHCAELASTTLNASGRYAFQECHKIHPQALYTALLPTHAAPEEVVIPSPPPKESWSVRAQRRCSRWFTWCGWSFHEAWLFCW